ncbi:putative uv-damaged dna binding [Phaeomoniella chlamydospora]|uniref:DNA damage-binding protein 1 n=1 Tax=Phaeomoniella chlamydospora TaxID=158046 RepID=A0A0G2GNP9_PHACM|nr:putative uv-damaged dna binding [Phaeomoniella chlamydospora]
MAYIVPIHRPSGVRHALKLRFLDPEEDSLIVAKSNRLEIYNSTPEGLVLLHSKTIYGFVTMLEKLRPSWSHTDHLFVGTDRYQYFTVSWDPVARQLKTEQSYVDQADKVLRDSREGDRSHIDPTGRFMSLELFEGVLTVLPIGNQQRKVSTGRRTSTQNSVDTGTLGSPLQARIEELIVRSSAFLQTDVNSKEKPRIAFLWDDNQDHPQLRLRELSYTGGVGGDHGSVELNAVADLRAKLDLGVSHLIPVSAPYGGFLVLGERSIVYVDNQLNNTISKSLEGDATVWTAWDKVDDQRWILGDDYGHLFFLMIDVEDKVVQGWQLDRVGNVSKPSVLVYLEGGYVYVGSSTGDSQVVRISEEGIEVVQSFANIAPILDFTIMDLGRGAEGGQASEFSSGQARIVTASGAWQDGSIRSVRSGVGMEDLGTVGEMSHITDLWALGSTGIDDVHDTLLVTFVNETRIFKFSPEAEVEEVDNFFGFELQGSTLLATNLANRRLLQIHSAGFVLVDLESGMNIARWSPKDTTNKITSAAANDDRLIIVENGTTLTVFDVSNDLQQISEKSFSQDSQIASVTIPVAPATCCIVSFWQNAEIGIFDLSTLDLQYSQSLGESGVAIPRSVLVANILVDGPPTLFIAMADGTVVTFIFDPEEGTLSGSNRIILGSEPVSFKKLPRGNGQSNVFATCEQPSLIYTSEDRVIYSAVNADKASRVCHFNSEAYPGSIAIATPEELKLALIDTERTTQLQSLPVGETVRCVAYATTQKAFGMGCIRRILENGEEAFLSSFKIADEVTFNHLHSYELNDGELVECVISTGPPDDDDQSGHGEMFILGTSVLEEAAEATVRGRILVFEISRDRKIKLVTEQSVKGACRSLAMCDGKIVAGLVKTVVIYALTPQPPSFSTVHLAKLATYRTATNPLSLCVTPVAASTPKGKSPSQSSFTIAVADLMKSLSILTYTPSPPGTGEPDSLVEVARHFTTLWSSAVTTISPNEWLLADMEGNLLVLRRNERGVTEDDRRRLEVTSEMLLGEVVNSIVPVNVPTAIASDTTSSADSNPITAPVTPAKLGETPVTPQAFLATVEGGVYLFATIKPLYQDLLMRLQSAIASRVKAPGHMPWNKYRAFKNEIREMDEPFRFVDGELVERFLDLDDDGMTSVVDEVGTTGLGVGASGDHIRVEDVKVMIEGLRRLH